MEKFEALGYAVVVVMFIMFFSQFVPGGFFLPTIAAGIALEYFLGKT